MKVEATGFRHMQAVMGNKESTLAGQMHLCPYTPSKGRVGTKSGIDKSKKQMPHLKRPGAPVICELRLNNHQ